MNTVTLFHGTNTPAVILDAIVGGGLITTGFHMTPQREVAQNYGSSVIAIEFEADLVKAHVGIINKEGNYNKAVGNGIEVVLKDQAAVADFYNKLWDAKITH